MFQFPSHCSNFYAFSIPHWCIPPSFQYYYSHFSYCTTYLPTYLPSIIVHSMQSPFIHSFIHSHSFLHAIYPPNHLFYKSQQFWIVIVNNVSSHLWFTYSLILSKSPHPYISLIYPLHLTIHPYIDPFIYSKIHPSIHLLHIIIHSFIHPFIYPNIHPLYLTIHSSIQHPSTYLSFTFNHPFILHPSIHLSQIPSSIHLIITSIQHY